MTTPFVTQIPQLDVQEMSTDIKLGFSGEFFFEPNSRPDSSALALRQRNTWPISDGYVCGSDCVTRSSKPNGWQVFVISKRPISGRILELLSGLEYSDDCEWAHQIRERLASPLFWELFPGAAIAATHPTTRVVCFIRDVLGFYPIYFASTRHGLAFSSSLSQLRQALGTTLVNERQLAENLLFGHHYGSQTVWASIDVVMPGQCVVFRRDSRPRRYSFANSSQVFDNDLREHLKQQPVATLATRARELIQNSLATSIGNDVPYVVQGGGGVDSSVLIALASKMKPDTTAWCISHPDLPITERDWTARLHEKLGITARFANVTRESFWSTFVETVWRSSQPLVGPNFVGGAILRKAAVTAGSGDTLFINGELCDTVFGGLSTFHQLAAKRRILNVLRFLPRRLRYGLLRGSLDERGWINSRLLGLTPDSLARIGYGSLERADLAEEVVSMRSHNANPRQVLADKLTWLDFRRVPSSLHHGFFERDEWYGGRFVFPFADPELLRFGFNLPWYVKYRFGHTKWLWRTMASHLIGRDTAFRAKRSFDAPLTRWLSRATVDNLLRDGFIVDQFRVPFGRFVAHLATNEELLWPLLNIEVWGRIHCRGEMPHHLLSRLMDNE